MQEILVFVRWWIVGALFTIGLSQGEEKRQGETPDTLATVIGCLIFWPLLAPLLIGRAITRGPK